jgi:hypothetical protein
MAKPGKAEKWAARGERLKAALRENLKRRKAQARGRASEGESTPAEAAPDTAAQPTTTGAPPDFRRNPSGESGPG